MSSIDFEKLYQSIFENSMDAILLTSPDGQIHHVNSATCKLFKKTEKEICQIGRNGLLDQEDTRIENLLKERSLYGSARGEVTFVKGDGTKFPGEFTSVIFTDAAGDFWTTTIIRDITFYKEAEEILKRNHAEAIWLASYDSLTGILNRRAFMERLNQEIERAKILKTPTCLIIADIDHFKIINDKFGHLSGDHVLQRFTLCLKENIREYDILGRFGGEEFTICLPNTKLDDGFQIAERIRAQVEIMDIILNFNKIKVTASFGISYYNWDNDQSIDLFISEADDAMYEAKINRNRVCLTT